jgi:hypothetical protein
MPKRLPLRVIIRFRGTDHKFFTLLAGKDNSFYIHPYRPEGQRWRLPGGGSQRGKSGKLSLDFMKFVEPSLEMNKLTLHPSGFIHVTDPNGRRYREGTCGPSFMEMPLPYQASDQLTIRRAAIWNHRYHVAGKGSGR